MSPLSDKACGPLQRNTIKHRYVCMCLIHLWLGKNQDMYNLINALLYSVVVRSNLLVPALLSDNV